jgi:pSer/pThr/pTyr-binding forkhead associated (FHA) protein
MISIEVLSRHRDVVARYRSDASAMTVGRAYDNDVVVDDPTVAAHHLRILRDEGGALIAEDLGSANGLFEGDSDKRSARLVLDGDRPIRIGRTYLRVREASYAVPPERRLATPMRVLPTVLWLAATLLGLELASLWLGETSVLWCEQMPRCMVAISSFCSLMMRSQRTRTAALAPWLGAQPAMTSACA